MIDVADNVSRVRARIARAAERAGRDPAGVTLIAAAKTKPAEMVVAAISAGIADIGENYVQEGVAKKEAVGRRACWHLIGHLQRNKAARAVAAFDLIQTVDGLRLGRALDRQAAARGRVVRVLVEVNIAGELSKNGVSLEALPDLAAGLRELPCLDVAGLMTIPPPGDPEAARPYFRRLRQAGDDLGLTELSMGMTEDFEIAIEEGATMVRVGRAIFGER